MPELPDLSAHAYHLRRAEEEAGRADRAADSMARIAHRKLAKLHRDRAGDAVPAELLIVRE
ncbi:MAG: hypothetical protein JWN66_2745 [Sphingomonas bacterium]|uniref:hypothetical protein n=1 Tax=Sphingomonas bacterium TaxID=1895847 RepID=UPI0026101F61|nr:hypothetical protein [Sphingomonas bacterium]MDB5705629.1 hypothetical protein [Sphingomonas bacterium]